ncbi:MAG: bifunctional phosphoribosylaminoimidazolecarboxamide formyltransferase/IMP cyclohydrolase [Planctomycetota bacterium]
MTVDQIPIRRALLSVFEKEGVLELAQALAAAGVEIISTGGTARLLTDAGLAVTAVQDVTEFPEMMDGRVKTLHPRIHGGLLMRRDLEHHVQAATAHDIRPIDLVVVNLYPFGDVVARPGVTEDEAIEMIDIGGPSMVRSAAKNHRFVAVVTDPADYGTIVRACGEGEARTDLATRRTLARKAFSLTARYDAAIAAWMTEREPEGEELPENLTLGLRRAQTLRYGENPHQRGALYLGAASREATVAHARQHSGKELSFNNYLDANAALEAVRGLPDQACVVIKHKNPCGAASRAGQLDAFLAAYAGDPVSAFGGIVAFNRPLDEETARAMATKERFFEVVVAPSYEGASLELLQTGAKWGKNVRLLEVGPIEPAREGELELRWIRGGLLAQDADCGRDFDPEVATRRAPDDRERADLLFAWDLCRNVTSNAIVFVKDRTLIGCGAGQMSRIDSVEIAAKKGGAACKGAVMASDAFFPFADGILAAQAAGIAAVIQPGGSMRDAEVVEACDEKGIAMLFTGIRHFRH